tara:strand:- start:170 stop:427 length:258 start_codon:yes stop_codon:yes gene_type:complete
MMSDTVLFGGLGILILGGLIWFLAQRVSKSGLSEKTRRLSIYLIIGGFILCVIMVMRWHSENYIAQNKLGSLNTHWENQNLETLS